MLFSDGDRYRPYFPLRDLGASSTIGISELSDRERDIAVSNGCKVYSDVQFYPVASPLEFGLGTGQYWRDLQAAPADAVWLTKTMDDVLTHINVSSAWEKTMGAGATVGVIDTGVVGSMPEFPATKQSLLSKSYAYSSPWLDSRGHGTMCAAASVGSKSGGGRYNGVAPEASLMSLRTSFLSTDIYQLYEWVIQQKVAGLFPGPVVLSNSYGQYSCTPPLDLPQDHPYLEIIRDAVSLGIVVIFAAGNNHLALCQHPADASGPNTIWGAPSVDEVLCVGSVNWDNRLDVGQHANSSRGPGQWAEATSKPDCVAPTYGEILAGDQYRKMEWWGTSGACPLVAGLAALMLAHKPTMTPLEVYQAIRDSSDPIGHHTSSQVGSGVINCGKALNAI